MMINHLCCYYVDNRHSLYFILKTHRLDQVMFIPLLIVANVIYIYYTSNDCARTDPLH